MTDENLPEDLMRYDVLTQEALRGVIRKVLDEVAVAGLPGDHHFFITFDTNFPGVRLSKRMREQYPEAMTIVIQHSFSNLETSDTGFEIDLSFNDIPERLRVPFASIQAFFDPSVKFGLQFEVPPSDEATSESGSPAPENRQNDSKKSDNNVQSLKPVTKPAARKPKPAAKPAGKNNTEKAGKDPAPKEDVKDKSGDVVSLDSFRKKK